MTGARQAPTKLGRSRSPRFSGSEPSLGIREPLVTEISSLPHKTLSCLTPPTYAVTFTPRLFLFTPPNPSSSILPSTQSWRASAILDPAATMNCPSRVDPVYTEGWNQNPDALNADATTRADFNHIASARLQRDHLIDPADGPTSEIDPSNQQPVDGADTATPKTLASQGNIAMSEKKHVGVIGATASSGTSAGRTTNNRRYNLKAPFEKAAKVLRKYARFIGPGFMVAVAYIDPGEYIVHFLPSCHPEFDGCRKRHRLDMCWARTVGSRGHATPAFLLRCIARYWTTC